MTTLPPFFDGLEVFRGPIFEKMRRSPRFRHQGEIFHHVFSQRRGYNKQKQLEGKKLGGGGQSVVPPKASSCQCPDIPGASVSTDSLVTSNQMLKHCVSQAPYRTRKRICAQICMQTLWCCLQPVWILSFTAVCSIICMRVLQGAPRPVWTGP